MKYKNKQTKKTPKTLKLVLGALLLAVFGFVIYKNLVTPSEIALVESGFGKNQTNCVNNVESFNSVIACSSTGFTEYTYTCKGIKIAGIVTGSCLSFDNAYAQATSKCGTTCPKPTPTPVVTRPKAVVIRARIAACKTSCRTIIRAARRNKCVLACK